MSAKFSVKHETPREDKFATAGRTSSRASTLKPYVDEDDPFYDEDAIQPTAEPEPEAKGVLGKLNRWKKKREAKQLEEVDGYEDAFGRFNIGKWGKDILLYVVFLALFTSIMFMGRNNNKVLAYTNSWRTVLREHTDEISNPDDMINFFENFLERGLLSPVNLDAGYASTTSFSGGLYDSILVGDIRVRQKRVGAVDCSSLHQKLTDRGNIVRVECYPQWSPGAEVQKYTKQQSSPPLQPDSEIFRYQTEDDTGQPGLFGFYGHYSGSGFVAAMNSDTVSEVLALVKEVNWIDLKTRAVFLEMTLYSPQLDMFLLAQLLFEVVPGGAVQPCLHIRGLFVDRYPLISASDRAKVFGEVLVYLFVLYFVVEEVGAARRQGFWRRYKELGWHHLDVLNLLLLLLAGTYKMSSVSQYNAIFGAEAEYEPAEFPGQLTELVAAIEGGDLINGINAFLLWLKVFKYAVITRRLLRLVSTIERAVADIAAFALLFSVIAYAFAVMGHLLLLQELPSFVSITKAAVTILRNAMAKVDFGQVMSSAGGWGFLFLLGWMVVSKTVVLNVVIAVLNDAYTRALDWEQQNPRETTYEKISNEVRRRHREGRLGLSSIAAAAQANKAGTEPWGNKKDKQNFDPHFAAKKRLGWVQDEHWQPYQPTKPAAPGPGPH